jgi:glycosyltransferase involved in cell wall biosynthesis
MRILMLSWEYPPRIVGGISRVVYHLAQELGAAGHQVTVLTMSDENLAPFEQDGTVSVVRVPSWYVRPITFVDSVMQMNMAMVTAAVRMIQSGSRFDVLHMHDWLVAFAGKTLLDLYPDLVGICTIHATEFGRNNGIHNDIQSYISGVEQKLAGELSSRVIVNSRYMREEVIRLFDVAADTLDIIPNGIDPHMFDPVPVDMSLRRCHAADNDRVVFFVGRLTYEKGVHLLMDAIPRVLARYQDVKFIIAGKGQELDALRQRAWNMGVAHRVDFPGFLPEEDLLKMFRVVDVAVFPSLYEPFGIVALEGMVAGLPVVVSDAGGLNEIVEDRVNGMKFPTGNPDLLADAIVTLLLDGDLRARITETAHRMIMEKYLWKHIAEQTVKTYESAMGADKA